ncbi:MAG: ketoacyl-ACP synthase III [Bdellovibrionales bacterium]|nr:ketoacyl-ACP synthase III [Bdellovibrionales bacterium]
MSVIHRAAITGVEHYFPEKILSNADMEKLVDTSDEWIRTRTGIEKRRRVSPGQASSDLACKAITKLLKKKKMAAKDIELIIVATVTPDMMFPSTACRIQEKMAATHAWGFDLSAACSGFVFALATADQFISSGRYKNALVVGVDVMSSIIDDHDRNTCVLFGDGCGVALLQPEPEASSLGILDHLCHIDGKGGEFLYMPGGGSLYGTSSDTLSKNMHVVHQEGKQVFKHAVTEMARVSEEILEKNNLSSEDIDYFIPHQANLRIIESCQKKLKLKDDQVIVNIKDFANTTSATIPTCMSQAVDDKKIKKGDLVLIASFGAGFTWGASLIRWAF